MMRLEHAVSEFQLVGVLTNLLKYPQWRSNWEEFFMDDRVSSSRDNCWTRLIGRQAGRQTDRKAGKQAVVKE